VTETRLLDRYVLPKVAPTVTTFASLAGTWLTMTTHRAGSWLQVVPRWLHLTAFGLWFGGAVWNIFIAVPAAREIVSLHVVVAASQQLERFRVAVRILLPTLIVTGVWQAHRYVGWNVSLLTASSIGLLVLFKLALVGLLIVVFLTCPMWRACSPIAGMCKLDDLHEKGHAGTD
jgi:putative copper resistance protein D